MPAGSRSDLTPKLTAIATGLMLLSQAALAQTTQTAPSANDKQRLERAQKQADAVFHWIKLNGEKGANRQQPAPAPPAPPAPPPAPAPRKPAAVAAAPKPAAPASAPVQAAAPLAPAVAPEPAPVQTAAAEPAAPEPAAAPPATVALATVPAPPPPPPAPEPEVQLTPLSRVNPVVPRQLQQQSFRNGFARVRFTVTPAGMVSKAEVLEASHNRLGPAAVEAIKQWRFAPIPAAREAAIEFAFNNAEE